MHKHNKTKILYFPERLIEAINGIFDYPLTIVEVPMGYGKTTAVRELLCDSNANILWLKIHDSSIYNFWTGFCHVLGGIDEKLANNLVELGYPNDSVSMQEALKLIVNIKLPGKTVLVHFLKRRLFFWIQRGVGLSVHPPYCTYSIGKAERWKI